MKTWLSFSINWARCCLIRLDEDAVLVFDSLRELLSHLINCRQAAVEYSEDTYCNSTVMLEWRRSDPFPSKHPLNSVDSLVYAFTVLRWCLSILSCPLLLPKLGVGQGLAGVLDPDVLIEPEVGGGVTGVAGGGGGAAAASSSPPRVELGGWGHRRNFR